MRKLQFFLLLGLFLSPLQAEKIRNYDIDVTIEKSGKAKIHESILYDFEGLYKHGIFRDIPLQIRYAGEIRDIGVDILEIKVDGVPAQVKPLTLFDKRSGKVLRLRIGDPDTTITGKHRYEIAYMVARPVLPASKAPQSEDAIRLNLVGTGWQVPIESIRATVVLPITLNKTNTDIAAFRGKYGETRFHGNLLWKDTHTLKIRAAELYPYEGITVEIAYDAKSGFIDQKGWDNVIPGFTERVGEHWYVPALLLYLFYLFIKAKNAYAGFEDKRSVAVRYLPPESLSVLQSGLLLDSFADDEDYAAAVVELAYLGHLRIDKGYDGTVSLVKENKATDSLSDDERYLLEGVLFPSGSKVALLRKGDETLAQRLKNGFKSIDKMLYEWAVKEGYMLENPQKTRVRFIMKQLLILIPFALLVIYSLYRQMGTDALFAVIFPAIFGTIAALMLFNKKLPWLQRLTGGLFLIGAVVPILSIPSEHGIAISDILTGALGALLVAIGAVAYLYKKIGKLSPKGAHIRKHLEGLKVFISRVKEDEIARRLEEEPDYLEKLLPYAMLFGKTKHWLQFYEILDRPTPIWLEGDIRDIDRLGHSVAAASTLPSQASTGGGFSGGGEFSGGGVGGGGGGSW